MSSSCKEFEAKAVEKAVQKASEALNIPKDKLKYNVISYGSTGIFGLVGAKKAKICVTLPPEENRKKKSHQRPKQKPDAAPPQKEKEDRSAAATAPTTAPAAIDEPSSLVTSLVEEAFGASTPKEPEQREERPASKPKSEHRKTTQPSAEKPEPEEETPRMDSEPTGEIPSESEDVAAAEPEPEEMTISPEMEESINLGKETLQRIIDFITSDAGIAVEPRKDRVLFNVSGGNPGILIGKRGQTLEAIQYLVEKVVNKHSEDRIRIQVDVEGYLDNRRASLEGLAKRLAEKTRTSGKPSTLGQMNAHDRRIVHLTLKNDNTVRTQSMGDGFYRKLVIFPKKRRKSNKRNNNNSN